MQRGSGRKEEGLIALGTRRGTWHATRPGSVTGHHISPVNRHAHFGRSAMLGEEGRGGSLLETTKTSVKVAKEICN